MPRVGFLLTRRSRVFSARLAPPSEPGFSKSEDIHVLKYPSNPFSAINAAGGI